MASSRLRHAVVLGLVTVAYVAAGRLGLLLAFVNESASAVWPPTGLAIAALLLLGLRVWPVVAVGAFLVNLTTSGVVGVSILIAAGNTLEAVVGASLTRRFAEGAAAFERTSSILRFTLVAAIGATTIAATVGVAALIIGGLAPPGDAGSIWFTWWLGDAVGAMVVTPLIVLWSRPLTAAWNPSRGAEAAALAACLLLVLALVFGESPAAAPNYPLEFLVVPVLLWAAFRFGARETATAAAVVGGVAVAGTLSGWGPFVRSSPNESLLLLQAFIGVTTIMMLSVAAEVKRRRIIETQIRALNEALEQRIAERTDELRRVNDRLIEAQQVAHVGSWEWDVGSNALWWSEELYRIYGLPPGEMTGYEAFVARVHPDDRDRIDASVRQAMVDGRPFTFEHRIVRPDGGVRSVYAAGRVVVGPAGRPVRMMGIGHDITERKQAEEERAQLAHEQAVRHEAEETSRAKDEFLAVLSHELRTPLNAALGWARALRELPPADPRRERAVEAIHRNLLIQARLVSDILDVSRIARGGLVLEHAPVDVRAVVDAAIDMVHEAAEARRITIEADVRSGGGMTISGDSKRLQQVLWNLLSNGVRFVSEGGRVRLDVANGADSVSITVEDDGPGIDPAFLPHVFEPFRQADPSPTRRHDGLGLGLAIARHIVELHGGTIAAANVEGGGARFTVRLPAHPGAAGA